MLMKSPDGAARLFYQPNGFRVLTPGKFVTCAVSGEAVPLDVLRYWSAELQEAYASAGMACKRLIPAR